MSVEVQGGLVRPEVSEAEAARIAFEHYGIEVVATELGSNQDRNFLLTEASGAKSVLRVDNPVFGDAGREAQHLALDAYRAAGVAVASVLPGLDGELTQRWNGFAVRRSEFAPGESMLESGYLAPVVMREFGALAAASVTALASMKHPGLDAPNIWDMRLAYAETVRLAPSITDEALRAQVLNAAEAAWAEIVLLGDTLPVQAIHGDLTDDNVMGVRGEDTRLHPETVLDLGDLGYGWRVAELAVTLSSLLHHEADRPLSTLRAVVAFNESAELSEAEARALWPLVSLRAALLIASGWRQLQIDGDNEYARDRIAGEQRIFDAATLYPLAEMTEQVLAILGFESPVAALEIELSGTAAPLRALLPWFTGEVAIVDPGVESASLDSGRWLAADANAQLVSAAFTSGAAAAVLPYGVYRLTGTAVNSVDGAATWPVETELHLASSLAGSVHAPLAATVSAVSDRQLTLDLGNGWQLKLSGFAVTAEVGAVLAAGAEIGSLSVAEAPQQIVVGLRRNDLPGAEVLHAESSFSESQMVAPERVPAWRRFSQDPAAILGLHTLSQHDEAADELARRGQIFASAQERYYEEPMQIERGWRHHLIDTTGRSYVDMVNNVTGLGHGHPGVADAVNRQIRVLNTNSRFLYRELAEYSERLLAKLPAGTGLDTVLLVNSGSEAVDLALRLAQAASGRKTIVGLREAYHGWTMASDAVTTSAYDNPFALENRPDWVHVADVPNRFRGTYRGAAEDINVGMKYADDLAADLRALAADDRAVGGFICESVLGNAGGVMLPEGYLAEAYRLVREAGGLCIADEVQVGFGRMGSSFWGFEQSGVTPDIIAIAKPMGNGFPIGGVITTKKIADALATQGQFFSSAGGNPLSCRVGIAVLDAMEQEGLQENARVVGDRLIAGFTELAAKHQLIGPIHGEGLYLGVELVSDRETMEPAKQEAAAICERLRELGVVVLTTSERSNVLKVKPPLCLTAESADFVVAQLDRVLTEGW
ncbi:aminotransferase [Leucobacter sp. UT-8R-CII-1-4]|uniref:aminotransferase n=1 Tax=Leucobacter sp. UT-8R-CII-1-4 TaxID=3040075 RepID=UPI0024A8DEF4|nr:aminotransferase [Leucobacter sp. UT-8R-CII-1-4]MDI6023025.1 aminotransferase [Leucobacter sp. UT-8R-CII-1-4]